MYCLRSFLQRKAERLERLRDDPFYLADDRPAAKSKVYDDVDSIPVVRLDDLLGCFRMPVGSADNVTSPDDIGKVLFVGRSGYQSLSDLQFRHR